MQWLFDMSNNGKTNGKLIKFLHDMGNTNFLASKWGAELKIRLPILFSLGRWGLWKGGGDTSYSHYIYACYTLLQTWTGNSHYVLHTQWHHFKYHFYSLCAKETDLLSVVILSLTAAIIALQPVHHEISMNNIFNPDCVRRITAPVATCC